MNTSTLPVITIITSKSCGHCTKTRNDGFLQPANSTPSILGTGGNNWAWNEKFFGALLRGGAEKGPQKFRVYEIHYSTMNPSLGVDEFSEFSLTSDGKVQRIGYYNKNNVFSTIKTIGYKQTKPSPTIVTGKTFVDVYNATFPKTISEFVFIYPTWIYTSAGDWNNAIKSGGTFYSYVASLPTIKLDDKFTVEKKREAIGKAEDPVLTAAKILNGDIILKFTGTPITSSAPTTVDNVNAIISSANATVGSSPPQIITARTGCSIPQYQLLPQ